MRQRRLRLGQPEGHSHGAVKGNGRRQRSAGLLPPTGLCIQGAKAPVAVGLERAHAQFVGQGESLLVVGFGRRHVWRVPMHGNLAEEPQGLRLPAPCFAAASPPPLGLTSGK